MSLRLCANCDQIINNRIHQDYDCPFCGSSDMVCPIEDDRDWDKMYKEQREEELEE